MTNNNYLITLDSTNNYLNENEMLNFKKITVLISLVGAFLCLLFLFLFIPVFVEYLSMQSLREQDIYSEKNYFMLRNLIYICFGGLIFNFTSSLVGSVHKFKALVATNVVSSFILGLAFIPCFMIFMGD